MASVLVVVPLGRLHMRPVQRWVASLKLSPTHRHRQVLVSMACVHALRPWRRTGFLTKGVAMGTVMARRVITTDASLVGWGATHEGRTVSGTWSLLMQSAHINYLELLAVSLALKHFLPLLRGQHVLVRTDNTTVVAYINRQGGLRSRHLNTLAHRLIVWSSSHLLSLRATHVPGTRNWGADLLSRGSPRYKDWKIRPGSSRSLRVRRKHTVPDVLLPDRPERPDGGEWPQVLLYAFPPIELITPTLARVRERGHALILIAPRWLGKHWLAEIYQLLCAQPWPLPLRRDLLSRAHGEIFHPHPERMALWAWPVRGGI
ncbi:uncharacterized protein LOC118103838 [Hippoglossus stenolepis]|uniref:uncharacterized protein LOC118103838 n=1 Tax=Hippoglossus stenolepis TaxID=195615 RepID=UPI00159C7683|nr:uncharacterized protein LOC118103838 [Hippoglossus stenolepis]